MADHALVREGGLGLVRLEIFIEEFLRAVEQQAPEEVLGFRTAEERNQFGDRDRRGGGQRIRQRPEPPPHPAPLPRRRGGPFLPISPPPPRLLFARPQGGGSPHP